MLRRSVRPKRKEYKVRADSKLMTLPSKRQAELFEFLRSHSYTQAAKRMRGCGVRTSVSALHGFFHWYKAQRKHLRYGILMPLLRRRVPGLKLRQYDLIADTVQVSLEPRMHS
jgi:hypothetical protein